MKRKTKGKNGWIALKLDMSKACDRIEWSFLQAVLSKIGFDNMNLFMYCVISAKYRISHARNEFENIVQGQGIRQGDPVSSYLFLICMEGLSTIIRNYESRKLLKGVQVARGAL